MSECKITNANVIASTESLLHSLKETNEYTDIHSQADRGDNEHNGKLLSPDKDLNTGDEMTGDSNASKNDNMEIDNMCGMYDEDSVTNNSLSDIKKNYTGNYSEGSESVSVHDEEIKSNAGDNNEVNSKPLHSKQEPRAPKSEVHEERPEWEDILGSGSLMKKVINEGEPNSRPQRLQNCTINYKCTLVNGTLVEKKDNFIVQLGDCEVIQGLDLALGLMNVGEVCILKIEPRLAYGTKGLDNLIPPNSSIHYQVELLKAEYEDDPELLSVKQRKAKGNQKRERGNWWYGRGENQLAIQCYRRALDFLDEVEGGITRPSLDGEPEVTDSALQDLLEDRISVSNNMAAAQLKLELYDAALQSLHTVLRCQPDNVKALFRKAKVLKAKNDLPSALKCLMKANSVSPNNGDIQKEISLLQTLMQKQKASERELARRMFNTSRTESSESADIRRDPNSSKLFFWATLGASLGVGLLGAAVYRFKYP